MSTVVAKNVQVGTSGTATDNFTIRQPATPDGTVRIANGNSGTTTDLVTLTSAGNLGVGTSSPAFRFDVQGGRSVLSANGEAFALGLRFNTATNGVWLGSPSANAFQISSFGGGAYLNIDSSGNVGIGKTSPQASLDYRETVNVISTSTTAVASRTYVFTASLTLTLPASPTAGDWVAVQNSSGTTTAVIARNGSNIMSLAENMTIDNATASLTLVYADATRGWVISL